MLTTFILRRYISSIRKSAITTVITVLTTACIAISTFIMLFCTSMINRYLADTVSNFTAFDGHISIDNYNSDIITLDKLQEITQYKTYVKMLTGESALLPYKKNKELTGVKIFSFQPSELKKYIKHNRMPMGCSMEDFKNGKAAVGMAIWEKIGRDTIRLGVKSDNPDDPAFIDIEVCGGVDTGFTLINSRAVFINNDIGKKLFVGKHGYDKLILVLKDYSTAKDIKNQIIDAGYPLEAFSWDEKYSQYASLLSAELLLIHILLSGLIVVCTISVLGNTTIMVISKTNDIILLKTLGLKDRACFVLFMGLGLSIALFAVLIGIFLFLMVDWNFASVKEMLSSVSSIDFAMVETALRIDALKPQYNISDIFYWAFFTLSIAFLSTIYPAYASTKVKFQTILRE